MSHSRDIYICTAELSREIYSYCFTNLIPDYTVTNAYCSHTENRDCL